MQSKTTSETPHEKVIVRQFAQANNSILAGADTLSNTMNTWNASEMETVAEAGKLHRMAKVHNI